MYNVTKDFQLQTPVMNIYWRESFTFLNSWFSFMYSFIPKPVISTEDKALENIVASTGNIGYNIDDYVIFGQNTRSNTADFLGVRVEQPITSLKVRDIYGNCLDSAEGKFSYSEKTELLRVGRRQLISCRLRVSTPAELTNRCNKLEIQSKF